MADSKITDLSAGGAVVPTDQFVVARSGADNKISGSRVLTGIVGIQQYAPASLATYNISGALAALDTTNLTVSFIVPDSGAVLVEFTALMSGVATHVLALGLKNHSGGAQLGNTWNTVLSGGDTSAKVMTAKWYLTGLSAGATLGIDIAGSTVSGTCKVFAQGVTGNASDTSAGPAVIVVFGI